MDLGFRGEVADFYHAYRRGYPAAVIDVLADTFGLDTHDVVIDLGCGTGQLTLPVARRVRAAVGVDPEPDMLLRARRAARDQGVANVSWIVGADSDMRSLGALLGPRSVGAVTIGQALHWMNQDSLFPVLRPLARDGGGVAVVTNGTPLWLQDSAWSRALRGSLEQWLDAKLTRACGTDQESQERYCDSLARAGFDVLRTAVDYTGELDLDQIVGGIYSALPVDHLPPANARPAFAEQIRRAIGPQDRFTEHVHVAMLLGRSR